MSVTHLDVLNIPMLKIKVMDKPTQSRKVARLKLKILERDKFRCVTCNRSKDLTIAHINPVGCHRNLSSYKLSNCRTLCEECHIKTEHCRENTVNYIHL